jgi:hypothetical protein
MSLDTKQGKPLSRTTSVQTIVDSKKPKLIDSNGLLITTEDAYTLTDGPTIFLCEDVAKIGNFYIQQTKIPTELFQIILKKIDNNNKFSEKIAKLESDIEDMENKIGIPFVDFKNIPFQEECKKVMQEVYKIIKHNFELTVLQETLKMVNQLQKQVQEKLKWKIEQLKQNKLNNNKDNLKKKRKLFNKSNLAFGINTKQLFQDLLMKMESPLKTGQSFAIERYPLISTRPLARIRLMLHLLVLRFHM